MKLPKNPTFVTVHTPLTPKTRGIVGSSFFNKAKQNLQIINVARGVL